MFWLLTVIILLMLWMFGPRARLKDNNEVFSKRLLDGPFSDLHKLTPKQAQNYLKKQESKFSDLVDATQSEIQWFDGAVKQKTVGVCMHGFSATIQEISPVPQNIAIELNANLLSPRLHGHGRHSKFMRESTAEDWLIQMWETINIAACLGDKIVLIGNSTGATLITWLMQQKKLIKTLPCKISSLVYVSPNFGLKHKAVGLLTLPWAKYWMSWFGPSHHIIEPRNALHAKFWTARYSIKSVYPLQVLIDWVMNSDLKLITTPTLFIYNEFDPVVNTLAINKTFKRFGSLHKKEDVWRIRQEDKSRHVIAGDIVAKENNSILTQNILDFIKPILNIHGDELIKQKKTLLKNESLIRDIDKNYDVLVLGGGINGLASAWELAQNGHKVLLIEKEDLAGKTSSNSSKLIHGGLRYLEQKEFKMVRNALIERERLMVLAPYLVRPLSFLIPKTKVTTFFLFRIGLWIYDHLYFKRTIKSSKKIKLTKWHGFLNKYKLAMRYYDCQCDDARLVIELAKSCRKMGVDIRPKMDMLNVTAIESNYQPQWFFEIQDSLTQNSYKTYSDVVINACGPWANKVHDQFFKEIYPLKNQSLRLIRGSHLLVKKISRDAFLLPNEEDGRIIFVLPYEQFSIIGTTEVEQTLNQPILISPEEQSYLLTAVNKFLNVSITESDILGSYSGIRPLVEDESSSDKTLSREFKVSVNKDEGNIKPILVNLLGGKITTFRLLGKEVGKLLGPLLDEKTPIEVKSLNGSSLSVVILEKRLHFAAPYLPKDGVARLIRAYGKECLAWFYGSDEAQLGLKFAASVYQVEVDYLLTQEWVYNVEDLMLRRSKFDWSFSQAQKTRLEQYVQSRLKVYSDLSQSRVNLLGSTIHADLSIVKL